MILFRFFNAKKHHEKISNELEYLKLSYLMVAEKLGIYWYYADSTGMTLDCGKCTLGLYKSKFTDVIGSNWLSFVYIDDLERVNTAFKLAVENKKDFSEEFKTHIGDGSVISIRSVARRVGSNYFGEITLIK